MSEPAIRHAYDLHVLPRAAARIAEDADHGWVFGLPRGIAPGQWPLDPVTGAPLMHGFTLLLPPDYRCHGPEIVGLSFFATPAEHNDGGAEPDGAFAAMIASPPDAPPANAAWRPYWEQARGAHPRLYRMTDILDYHYAVILLTADEIAGPVCEPPPLPTLDGDTPEWVTSRDMEAVRQLLRPSRPLGLSEDELRALRTGTMPPTPDPAPPLPGDAGSVADFALRWEPRATDPNAGKAPRESYDDEPTDTGYQSYSYYVDGRLDIENYREHEWSRDHLEPHIGGTMRPVQGIPEMSPYYVEFDESFGGYNFGGGGNAQLDFKTMTFDWACG